MDDDIRHHALNGGTLVGFEAAAASEMQAATGLSVSHS